MSLLSIISKAKKTYSPLRTNGLAYQNYDNLLGGSFSEFDYQVIPMCPSDLN
jgi:hypothetical protein